MTQVFQPRSYGRFIQSNLRRKKLRRTNQGSNFLGGSFSNRYCKSPNWIRTQSLSRIWMTTNLCNFGHFWASISNLWTQKIWSSQKMQTWKYVVTTETSVGKSLLRQLPDTLKSNHCDGSSKCQFNFVSGNASSQWGCQCGFIKDFHINSFQIKTLLS